MAQGGRGMHTASCPDSKRPSPPISPLVVEDDEEEPEEEAVFFFFFCSSTKLELGAA